MSTNVRQTGYSSPFLYPPNKISKNKGRRSRRPVFNYSFKDQKLFIIGSPAAMRQSRSAGYEQTKSRSAEYEQTKSRSAGYEQTKSRSAGYEQSTRDGQDQGRQSRSAGYEQAKSRSAGYEQAKIRSAGYEQAKSRSAGYESKLLESSVYNRFVYFL